MNKNKNKEAKYFAVIRNKKLFYKELIYMIRKKY